jgi:hypothetical protein
MHPSDEETINSLEHVEIFVFPKFVLSGETVLKGQESSLLRIITVSGTGGLLILVSISPHYGRELRISPPNLHKASQ